MLTRAAFNMRLSQPSMPRLAAASRKLPKGMLERSPAQPVSCRWIHRPNSCNMSF